MNLMMASGYPWTILARASSNRPAAWPQLKSKPQTCRWTLRRWRFYRCARMIEESRASGAVRREREKQRPWRVRSPESRQLPSGRWGFGIRDSRVISDPIGFPSPSAIVRESLFEMTAIGGDIRPDVAYKYHPFVDRFL